MSGMEKTADCGRSQTIASEAVRDLLDAIKGLLDWVEIDKLPMDRDALFIARKAIAKAEAGNG